MQSMSSRAFNRNAGAVKRAAANGPVFITDRGKTAHVLLTIEDYHALLNPPGRITQPPAPDTGTDLPQLELFKAPISD